MMRRLGTRQSNILNESIKQWNLMFDNVIAKVAIIETKNATIGFFSSPPFLLFFFFVTMILELPGLKERDF